MNSNGFDLMRSNYNLQFVIVENYNKICNVVHSNVNDEHFIECNSISEYFCCCKNWTTKYIEYVSSWCYQLLFVIGEQFFVVTIIKSRPTLWIRSKEKE